MKFLLVLVFLIPSLSLAAVQKVRYECKGNARTFIGPNEVPGMAQGKSFKFEKDEYHFRLNKSRHFFRFKKASLLSLKKSDTSSTTSSSGKFFRCKFA